MNENKRKFILIYNDYSAGINRNDEEFHQHYVSSWNEKNKWKWIINKWNFDEHRIKEKRQGDQSEGAMLLVQLTRLNFYWIVHVVDRFSRLRVSFGYLSFGCGVDIFNPFFEFPTGYSGPADFDFVSVRVGTLRFSVEISIPRTDARLSKLMWLYSGEVFPLFEYPLTGTSRLDVDEFFTPIR